MFGLDLRALMPFLMSFLVSSGAALELDANTRNSSVAPRLEGPLVRPAQQEVSPTPKLAEQNWFVPIAVWGGLGLGKSECNE